MGSPDYTLNRLEEVFKGQENLALADEQAAQLAENAANDIQRLVSESLDGLDGHVTTMQNLVNQSTAKEIGKEFESTVHAYTKILRTIKGQFEEFTKNVQTLSEDGQRNTEYQLKKNGLQKASLRLNDIIGRFNQIQTFYKDANRDKIKKTLEMTDIQATDADIDNMLQKEDYSLFDEVAETTRKKDMLRAIEERQHEFMRLEKAIIELNELFTQISFLIEQNQENIDNIENNYANVREYVADANIQLEKALEHKKSMGKTKIIIIVVVVVIIVIIIIAIIATYVR